MATDIVAKTLADHDNYVKTHCRICGRKLEGTTHSVSDFVDDMSACFSVNISDDITGIHPTKFCNNCKRSVVTYRISKCHGKTYRPGTAAIDWVKHPRTGQCPVCSNIAKPGRKRKERKNRGRPRRPSSNSASASEISMKELNDLGFEVNSEGVGEILKLIQQKAVRSLVKKSLSESDLLVDRCVGETLNLTCTICKQIYDKPVLIDCNFEGGGHMFCAECISEWIQTTQSCPVCRTTVTTKSIASIPNVVFNLLLSLKVKCDYTSRGCHVVVDLENVIQHESQCQYQSAPVICDHDYCLTNQEISTTACSQNDQTDHDQNPEKSLPVPLAIQTLLQAENLDESPGFEELTTACMKKKLSTTTGYKSGVPIKLKTRGQPICLTYTPQSRKTSGEASERTKAKRAKWVEESRCRLSGGEQHTVVQQQKEVKRISKEDKDALLQEIGMVPNIPEGAGLFLKSVLNLPWNKLRSLKRWLRSWKIRLGSERMDRHLAAGKKYQLVAENKPFVFSVRGPEGKQDTEIRLAPCVAVQDLVHTIDVYLDYLER
ncbi:uncharacterized protein [Ptychodera flava]|uniref:uncharacterized protein n=1 Tax=Ptychodera flava TaxID=63121 RepID=UPI003969CAD6